MGACVSTPGVEVSEADKVLHRLAEKELKEVNPNPFKAIQIPHTSLLGQVQASQPGQGSPAGIRGLWKVNRLEGAVRKFCPPSALMIL